MRLFIGKIPPFYSVRIEHNRLNTRLASFQSCNRANRGGSHSIRVALVIVWQLDNLFVLTTYLVHIHISKKGMVLEMLSL